MKEASRFDRRLVLPVSRSLVSFEKCTSRSTGELSIRSQYIRLRHCVAGPIRRRNLACLVAGRASISISVGLYGPGLTLCGWPLIQTTFCLAYTGVLHCASSFARVRPSSEGRQHDADSCRCRACSLAFTSIRALVAFSLVTFYRALYPSARLGSR